MRRAPPLVWLLGGLLAAYLIAPFLAGAGQMGRADWAGADVSTLWRAAEVSAASATLAAALILLGGAPLAYVLARGRPRGLGGRALAVLGLVVQLPLALPPLASGVLLLFLLGPASPLGRLSGGALTDSFAGVVLAETFVAAPFLIIAARQAFAAVDPELEQVAATLGRGPGFVLARISLPLAWRGLLAGLLLAWLRAFGEFGATVMVAYHPYTLPVYTYVAFGSSGLPAMLPVLAPTLAAALAVLLLSQLSLGRRRLRMPEPTALPALEVEARPPPAQTGGAPFVFVARHRLDGFTLDIDWRASSRRLAILGASGSGKSLTLRLIAGLEEPSPGEVEAHTRFDGRRLDGLAPQRRGVAYAPQSYGLFPHLDVHRQVRFAADCDPTEAARWTERLGLSGLERRRPGELSLGQQQRVALARALSRRQAGLILLDEPFSALDAPLRARLRQEMLALQGEWRATTILVTHDPAEAMLLADELLLLQDGRVLQAGRVEDVFARPASETAARLLGAEAVQHGRIAPDGRIDLGQGVQLAVGGPRLAPGAAVGWAVRPQQVRIGREGEHAARILMLGPATDGRRRVTLQLGDAVLPVLADPGCPSEGDCRASIDPDALQVWPASLNHPVIPDGALGERADPGPSRGDIAVDREPASPWPRRRSGPRPSSP